MRGEAAGRVSDAPWTFGEARQKCIDASKHQEQAEKNLREAARDAAVAEETYRKALANEMLRGHADGVAWTAAADLARGDKRVAELRRERDIAEGVREAMVQAAWRRAADRKDAQRFSDWSQRRQIAEGYGQTPDPDWSRQPIEGAGVPAGVNPQTGEIQAAA